MRRGLVMLLLIGLAGLFLAGCSGEPAKPGDADKRKASADKPLKLAVIPKGTMHVFWKSVHAGAVKAEKELPNVSIIWQGPVQEDDRRAQIDLVETFIQKRVDGIVLAPLDDRALITPVLAAKKAGIPVVIIDSDLADPEAYVSFVATDNHKGGMMGAQCLAKLVGDKGKVILLRYQVGSASTENREKGFMEEIAKHTGIQVVSSDQQAWATVESAMTAAQSLLTKFGEGQVDGIGPRGAEPRPDGPRRRGHDGRPPAGAEGREAGRHRRDPGDAGEPAGSEDPGARSSGAGIAAVCRRRATGCLPTRDYHSLFSILC
ncbi:MAG: substrate-binding domain-containing protein [Planctomycetota bacterium]|nr:substrate-binding domain-containing protein [Planctomycetota bacterium]